MTKERIQELQAKAARAREVAALCDSDVVAANLRSYAVDLDAEATRLQARLDSQAPVETPEDDSPALPEALAALKPLDPDPSGEA